MCAHYKLYAKHISDVVAVLMTLLKFNNHR